MFGEFQRKKKESEAFKKTETIQQLKEIIEEFSIEERKITVKIIKKEEFKADLDFVHHPIKNIKFLNVYKNYKKENLLPNSEISYGIIGGGSKIFKKFSKKKFEDKKQKTSIDYKEKIDFSENDLKKQKFQEEFSSQNNKNFNNNNELIVRPNFF